MSGVTNNRNNTYQHTDKQEDKKQSVSSSKNLVEAIQNQVLNIDSIVSCEQYEPCKDLRIGEAPAVRLPNGKLVIAPDLICELNNGQIFWVEVKDKCQRFFKPDTGADLHQILGFYQINNELSQPVLMIFKDASLHDCSVSSCDNAGLMKRFKERWDLFGGRPYGAWLSTCLMLNKNSKYPIVAFDKSRDIPMFIFYFYVYDFKEIDFQDVLNTITKEEDNLKITAYRKNKAGEMELCDEDELKDLSIENLTLVSSPQGKYKGTPIVDINQDDLYILATYSRSDYQEESKKELYRRETKRLRY